MRVSTSYNIKPTYRFNMSLLAFGGKLKAQHLVMLYARRLYGDIRETAQEQNLKTERSLNVMKHTGSLMSKLFLVYLLPILHCADRKTLQYDLNLFRIFFQDILHLSYLSIFFLTCF